MPRLSQATSALRPPHFVRVKTERTLILLTFLGIVGIYIGAWLAYQKYQAYQATLAQKGTLGGLLSIFSGN